MFCLHLERDFLHKGLLLHCIALNSLFKSYICLKSLIGRHGIFRIYEIFNIQKNQFSYLNPYYVNQNLHTTTLQKPFEN